MKETPVQAENEALQSPPAAKKRLWSFGRYLDLIGTQNLSLLIALVLLIVIIGSQNQDFFLPGNVINIGLAVSLLGLVAIGQTLVIVSGGLDISVGSITGLASVVAATIIASTNNVLLAIAAGLLIGAAAGAFNALIIIFGRVNPVITTLATLSAFSGLAFIITDGQAIGVSNETFNYMGSGRIAGVPIPVIVLIAAAVIFFTFLQQTDLGRNIYAIGGNPVAARLAGINLTRYKLMIYTLSGLIAGIAGIILTARTNSGQPASGSQGLELESITAAVLGGCALSGGKGTIIGTVLGVIIIGTLDNGMILLNVQTFYQLVAKGALLVIAVMIQELRLRSSARAK